jgi:hypothetical protein
MPEQYVRLAAQLQAAYPDRVPGRLGGQAAELPHGPGPAAAASYVYSRQGDYSRQADASLDDGFSEKMMQCGCTSTPRGGGKRLHFINDFNSLDGVSGANPCFSPG